MKKVFLLTLILSSLLSVAQKRNNIWCFGDSALIDFNIPNSPSTGASAVRNRGSCVSIADTAGQLLFYANTRHGFAGNTTLVWNKNNVVMQNGDSIVGEGWYNELVITPFPYHPDQYFLFSIGITTSGQTGLYYSLIDMSMNGGLGAVTQKNIQLLGFRSKDGIKAVKHGNGKDWWVIYHQWDTIPSNQFHVFLIDSSGVHQPIIQHVGSLSIGYPCDFVFTQNGSRFFMCNGAGLIERYDFDRCSGVISNSHNISPIGNFIGYFGIALSKNDSVLYISSNRGTYGGYLYQFDLTNSNILSSGRIIYTFPYTTYPGACGLLRLAPDDKIYLSIPHWGNSLYYDSVDYSPLNMNLSVINNPNIFGTGCDFQPYSFYLGGKRTYWGLPNNPDYDLGLLNTCCNISAPSITQNFDTLSVSPTYLSYQWYHDGLPITGATNYYCIASSNGDYNVFVSDSVGCTAGAGLVNFITRIKELEELRYSIYPNPSQNDIFIKINVESYNARADIFNLNGEIVYSTSIINKTENIHNKLSSGMYFLKISDGKQQVIEKLIVQ